MKISFIQNTQRISNIKHNQLKKSNNQTSDLFIKSTSFGQITDNKSYADFDRWAKSTNFKENAKEIIKNPNNYLGKDSEGDSYKIPDCDKWIIKKPKNDHLWPIQVKETTYTEIDDISPRINIGQPIASLRVPLTPRITEHYYIHKAQEGGKLGLHSLLMRNVNSDTSRMHIESLAQVSALEQESYDELVKNITEISRMGYSFDGKKPNNLTLDSKKKRINLTNLAQNNTKNVGQFSEVLYALLGGDFSSKFNHSHRPDSEKEKANYYTNIVCAKFLVAMKNNGSKFELTDNFKDLVTSSVFTRLLQTDDSKEKVLRLRKNGLI